MTCTCFVVVLYVVGRPVCFDNYEIFVRACYLNSLIFPWIEFEVILKNYISVCIIFLTRFNKIAIQGTPQMAVDKEAISLSRVYLNTILSVPAVILCVTRLN